MELFYDLLRIRLLERGPDLVDLVADFWTHCSYSFTRSKNSRTACLQSLTLGE